MSHMKALRICDAVDGMVEVFFKLDFTFLQFLIFAVMADSKVAG
jgi:hypothetical protein